MRISNNFGRKGQVALFVIIALVIVGGIILLYTFKDQLFAQSVPAEVAPVFNYYKSCIEQETTAAIGLIESQGGRIDSGVYAPGSEYAPFSSQLNFLGFPIPYWFYIAGNGVVKDSVPTKSDMQKDIAQYVQDRVNADCNFNALYDSGFAIDVGDAKVSATINDNDVAVSVNAQLTAEKNNVSARLTSYDVKVQSSLGKLYNSAKNVYTKERNEAFFEGYAIDVMRNYAPVDGVEISCSGKIWKTRDVVNDLKDGLEANMAAVKFNGDYYTKTKANEYFRVDLPVDEQVNVIYSKDWPTKVEIAGADNELMIASPVGNQQGMGAMGFCYSPYHFVYDVSYPVLVQLISGQEVFQFPMVVIIDKNVPRLAQAPEIVPNQDDTDICQFNTKQVSVNVFDTTLQKVDANISLECFNQRCDLGSTTDGTFSGMAPACYNGYVKVNAEGYSEKSQLFSTNEESSIDVILDRQYNVKVNLEVGGKPLQGTAIIAFNGESKSVSTFLPDSNNVILSEGLYNITVYAYDNSSLVIPGSTKTQCHEVASGGVIGGLLGSTKEECFDIKIPETKVESALVGGGKSEIYILPSDLEKGEITLRVDSLPRPNSIEELQNNFAIFDIMKVELAI